MANINIEKINFNVSPTLKRDIERLASYHGKSLSAFMLEVCNILAKNNSEKIKEQAAREKEPIIFSADVKTDKTTKTKKNVKTNKKAVQVNGGVDNG